MAFADHMSPTTWEYPFDDVSDSESQSDLLSIQCSKPLAGEIIDTPSKIDIFDTLFTPNYYSRIENPLADYIMDSPIFQHNLFPENETVEPKPHESSPQPLTSQNPSPIEPPLTGDGSDQNYSPILAHNANNGYGQGCISPQATLLRHEQPQPQVALPQWTNTHSQHTPFASTDGGHSNATYPQPFPRIHVDPALWNRKRDEVLAVLNSDGPRACKPVPIPSGGFAPAHHFDYPKGPANVPPHSSCRASSSRSRPQRVPTASHLRTPTKSMYPQPFLALNGYMHPRNIESQKNSTGDDQHFSLYKEERTRTGRTVRLPLRYRGGGG